MSPGPQPPPSADIFPPRPIDSEAAEAGRLLFARDCRFVAGVAAQGAFPEPDLPEIAFAGRSNVGKSSLVNAVAGRRMLARTSNTPGRTRQINFFDVAGRLMLVDLPGYGYADAPKAAVAAWTALVERYLRGRPGLQRVCLLIDSRHGIKETDRPVMRLLDRAGISYQAVLTKTDKLRGNETASVLDAVSAELARHPAAHPELLLTSAETGRGIAALRTAVLAAALPDLPMPTSL